MLFLARALREMDLQELKQTAAQVSSKYLGLPGQAKAGFVARVSCAHDKERKGRGTVIDPTFSNVRSFLSPPPPPTI